MKDFNLLEVIPKKREKVISLRSLLLVFLGIIFFIAATIYPYYYINLLKQQLVSAQKQERETSSIKISKAVMAERLKQQSDIIDNIVQDQVKYSDAMVSLQQLKPLGVNIYGIRYGGFSVEIEGLANSITDITEFLAALNNSSYYEDAVFNSINASPEPAGYIFKISARVVPPAKGR